MSVGRIREGANHRREQRQPRGDSAPESSEPMSNQCGNKAHRKRGSEGEYPRAGLGPLRKGPRQLDAWPIECGEFPIVQEQESSRKRRERIEGGHRGLAHCQYLASKAGGIFIVGDWVVQKEYRSEEHTSELQSLAY